MQAELDRVAKVYGGGAGIDMTKFPEMSWLSTVHDILCKIGMYDLWMYEGNGFSCACIKKAVKLRINDIFIQTISTETPQVLWNTQQVAMAPSHSS